MVIPDNNDKDKTKIWEISTSPKGIWASTVFLLELESAILISHHQSFRDLQAQFAHLLLLRRNSFLGLLPNVVGVKLILCALFVNDLPHGLEELISFLLFLC